MRARARWAAALALGSGIACVMHPGSARADGGTWPGLQTAPQVQADASKDAALIIGIEEYAFVPHVDGATANARDWFTFLVEGQKMPISRAHLLRNRDATREQILEVAKRVAGEVEPGGKLWLVFIGHGAPSADGKDGVLVGVDAQQTASGLYARSVARHELLDAVSGGSQANTIAVIDACFSGRTSSGAPLAPGLQPLIRVKESAPPRVGRSATTILTAGHSDQFAGPLPGVNRPAFSYLVLGALRGWGDKTGKGTVTAEDAADYAKLALTVVPIGRTQTPEITSPNAKVELSHGAKEKGPELSKIVSAGDRPATGTEAKPAAPPVPGGNGRLRVRATCGTEPKVIAGKEGLVVEEIMDTHDLSLKPQSDVNASLKYDEASHDRVMKDPEFVDYDLPAGSHRIRVRGKLCLPVEQQVVIEPGATLEYAPTLQREIVPLIDVKFERPAFASSGDVLELRAPDGKVPCANLPCSLKLPAKENGFALAWKQDGGAVVVGNVMDPGGSADQPRTAHVEKTRSVGMLGPAVIGGGAVVALGALAMFAAAGGSHQCTYTGSYGTGAGSSTTTKTDFGTCGSGPQNEPSFVVSGKNETTTPVGYMWVGVAAAGGAGVVAGVVLAALKVGGKDTLSVTYGSSSTAKTRLFPTANGIGGTF